MLQWMATQPCTYCITKWTQRGEKPLKLRRKSDWVYGRVKSWQMDLIKTHSVCCYQILNKNILQTAQCLNSFPPIYTVFIPSIFCSSFVFFFILFLFSFHFMFLSTGKLEGKHHLISPHAPPFGWASHLDRCRSEDPTSWLCKNRISLKFCILCSCLDQDIQFLPFLQLPGPAELRFTLEYFNTIFSYP